MIPAYAVIEQQGRVSRIQGHRAWVELGSRSGCAACDAGRGCGAGVFGRLVRRGTVEIDLENSLGAERGQAVLVGIPESAFLALVGRMYALPLFAGLVVGVVCHQVSVHYGIGKPWLDGLTLIGLVAGSAAAFRIGVSSHRVVSLVEGVRMLDKPIDPAGCEAPVP